MIDSGKFTILPTAAVTACGKPSNGVSAAVKTLTSSMTWLDFSEPKDP